MSNFDYDALVADDGEPIGVLPSDILDLIDKKSDTEGIEKREEYLAHFNESIDRRGKNKLAQLSSEGQGIYLLKADIPSGGMVGIQVFMLLEKLSDGGEVFGTLPEGDNVANGKFDDGIILLLTNKNDQVFEKIFQEVFNLSPVYETVSPKVLNLVEIASTGKVALSENEKVDSLINQVEEMMLFEDSVTIGSGDSEDGSKQIDEIKVKVDDLNKLFRLIEELVLIRNQFIRINETEDYSTVKDINTTLDRTTNDLYLGVLKLRMVSIGQIFNHLRQVVSKLADDQGKFIDFIIHGEDVAVDRKILEELVEPMKALISNAVTHGIETPEERVKKGKHRVGTLTLMARNEDETIQITLEDDGRGMSHELVKKTALDLGLTSEKIVEGLSGDEVFDLLTLPGFTTDELGELSQTKVMGLNAVKQRIESNSGTIEFSGDEETGLTTTVVLPTNMAIIKVLLFEVKDQIFAIPSSSIQTILDMGKVTVDSELNNTPLIQYQEKIIPAHNLGEFLGLQEDESDKFGIVIEKRHKRSCVVVSRVLGFEDVVVKTTEGNLMDFPWIVGMTVLSDGKAAPILDLWSLIHS